MERVVRRTVYPIAGLNGQVIAEHVRIDFDDGSKSIAWRRPGCSPEAGLAGLALTDLPLYGTERLARLEVGRTVVVTEGEKAAESIWRLGGEAVGTVTGAAATPGEDALAVLLPFDVVCWPDFDDPGVRHMTRVAAGLVRLGGLARRLTWGHQKGDDAADFLERGGTAAVMELLVQAATSWQLEPERRSRPRPEYAYGHDSGRSELARQRLVDVVTERLGAPASHDRRGLWWRCPFHDERTASFKVDLREPFYRCFGCDAKGDVFTFLAAYDGAGFKDAIRELVPIQPRGAVMPL
jgi:DNA primase